MTHYVPLLDAAAAQAGDRAAVDAGASWAGLMDRAAGHLARGIITAGGRRYGLRVTLVVGKGNNGGDGWAAARRLHGLGARPWVIAVPGLDVEMSEEAADNRTRFRHAGGRASGPDRLDAALADADVVVDCLLGTGATGAPRGDVGDAVAAINRAGATVVACDLPTGVQADDGHVPGEAVEADLTVTFGGMKKGLLLHPGASYAGRVRVGDLGREYDAPDTGWTALTAAGAAPSRLGTGADKHARGVVLVVAGSRGMAGAAILAARGAMAAGAGLTTVAVPASIQDVVANAVPPAMTLGLSETDDGSFAPDAAEEVAERAQAVDVVATGPGLTPSSGSRQVVDAILANAPAAVLDADGLNVFRGEGDRLADHAGELVVTPHVRELSRIGGGEDADDAWRRRSERVPELAQRLRATVLAKGPGSIVAGLDGRVWVTPVGGPALGAGGSGDVLTGVVAAAVAAADDVPLAVARACWWHAFTGDLAGELTAERSGSELLADLLPGALADLRDVAAARPAWPFDPPGWHAGRRP